MDIVSQLREIPALILSGQAFSDRLSLPFLARAINSNQELNACTVYPSTNTRSFRLKDTPHMPTLCPSRSRYRRDMHSMPRACLEAATEGVND